MKNIAKAAALALAPVLGMSMASVPALAQSRLGVAVVNVDQAVANSNAYRTATEQMKTTYKSQIDAFNTRKAAIDKDLETRATTLRTAMQAAGGKPSPALQQQYEDLQQRSATGQQELQRLGQPIGRAQAYVEEQIVAKLSQALQTAMTKSKVDLLVSQQATVSYKPDVDITSAVTTELNTLVPSVSITPPAGWQPGGQQQGAAAAPSAPAAPAAPATQQPATR